MTTEQKPGFFEEWPPAACLVIVLGVIALGLVMWAVG